MVTRLLRARQMISRIHQAHTMDGGYDMGAADE